MVPQTSAPPHPIQRVETSVDPEKSIIISSVSSRAIIKNSDSIIRNFNKHHSEIGVSTYFSTKGGSIIIELKKSEDAINVCSSWDPSFFTDESSTKPTSCCVMKNSNKSVLLKNVPLDISMDELHRFLANKYNNPKLLRFRTRKGVVLKTIKADFSTVAEQEQCLKDGIHYEGLSINTEKYIPRKRVIQCYKCWRFGHIADLCPNKVTCVNCARGHKNCETRSAIQLRCSNCKGNHPANDRICPAYKEVEYKVFSTNSEQNTFDDY